MAVDSAVHPYIHLFESSAQPERALPQADRLESLMPKAGHMVNMPSHIYVRTGDYEKAIANNERSLQVDEVFQKEWGDRATPNLGTYGLSSRTHHRHAWTLFVTLRCTAYVEPPGWGQSMRLYLGEALLKAGRARLAEVIYREDLREFRNNGWALFGLAQSLRAQGKSAAARKVDEEFQRAWKNADVTLKASVF